MIIKQGENPVVIKIYDKNSPTAPDFRGIPISGKRILLLLDALPLNGGESTTNADGQADFGEFQKSACDINNKSDEIYIQGGQIFVDGLKVYDGPILPEMNFYI